MNGEGVIDWEHTAICYTDDGESVEDVFDNRLSQFMSENGALGLDAASVMDKCVNTVIELLSLGIIKSCTGVDLSEENGIYTFTFGAVFPDSSESVNIKVNLEVAR